VRPRRRPIRWSYLKLSLCCLSLGACASPAEHALDYARSHQLTAEVIQGDGFQHQIYWSPVIDGKTLYVFIEGDGVPWTAHGKAVASDPTPVHPLALELAAHTPHALLYLGRPCYFGVGDSLQCTADTWTSARYSQAVVDSMVAAANRFAARGGYQHLVLVGYSGGGTLAVLMAPKLAATRAVITIAANLDVNEWAREHNYVPLDQSLDPARQPPLPPGVVQRYLFGGRDLNVPERSNARFLQRVDARQIWRFPAFDHVCCWTQQWPQILERLDAQMALSAP
jgi:hypothetical protein